MTKLLAFHGDAAIKAKYIERVKQHAARDQIVHGQYWEGGKGCAVGCTIHSKEHDKYESMLGIPQTIAHLEDLIFEGMRNGDSKAFPLQFLEAIQIGADLSLVWPKFAIWLLTAEKHGVRQYARPSGQAAIDAVVELYRRQLNGESVDSAEWRAAADAADAAYTAADAAARTAADAAVRAAAYAAYARTAANAAARAAARTAARTAADAAARAAADAADAAYAAAYAADARTAAYTGTAAAAKRVFWQAARDELLRLLATAIVAIEV